MTRIVVLFNLREEVAPSDYEAWARSTDMPIVNRLDSVDGFSVHRSTGLLIGEDDPPYAYVEIIDVNDMQKFGAEVSEAAMQRVAGEFAQFADAPCFILTEDI